MGGGACLLLCCLAPSLFANFTRQHDFIHTKEQLQSHDGTHLYHYLLACAACRL